MQIRKSDRRDGLERRRRRLTFLQSCKCSPGKGWHRVDRRTPSALYHHFLSSLLRCANRPPPYVHPCMHAEDTKNPKLLPTASFNIESVKEKGLTDGASGSPSFSFPLSPPFRFPF